jgi:uncharacterized protein
VLTSNDVLNRLETRLGPLHSKLRLGLEREHEAHVLSQRLSSIRSDAVEAVLRASGTYWRGQANARNVELRCNDVLIERLSEDFEGYTILHLSDLHAETSGPALQRVNQMVRDLKYDLCALTGDYRGATFGDWQLSLEFIARLRAAIRGEIYAVLGNYDSILMIPDLEEIGIRVLLNERAIINRGTASIYLAGVDDAHFYRADNIEKAAADIPNGSISILLSHTPEIYRQAAHAGFDLMLSGHTHGGQICLPGGIPVLLNANIPRALGAGAWRHLGMAGYTSVGAGSSGIPVRFNNRPEITLHRLHRA